MKNKSSSYMYDALGIGRKNSSYMFTYFTQLTFILELFKKFANFQKIGGPKVILIRQLIFKKLQFNIYMF